MNYQATFERRFYALLKAVDPQPRCTSRQEAHDLLLKHWVLICEKNGLPKTQVERMKSHNLSTAHGWHNLDQNPCHWDSNTSPGVRIYLHDDGLIVMQRINDGEQQEILFLK